MEPIDMTEKRYRWDAIIDRVDKDNPIRIAEIGVWRGGLSGYLLKNLPLMTLIQVDRWTNYSDREIINEGNSRMSRYKQDKFDIAKAENAEIINPFVNRVIMLEMDSRKAASHIEHFSLDLVFLDAAHSFDGHLSDILSWIFKVKPGGWIGGHDYSDSRGVKKAVHHVFQESEIELDSNKTWFVRM
jgi:hypothetical protein